MLAGDLTDEGYPDQYPLAKEELSALACPLIVRVLGNHDARNVGYLHFARTPSAPANRASVSSSTGRGRRPGDR